MQKILIYIHIFLYSCSFHSESLGSYNEVLVFSSEEDRLTLKLIFDNLFNNIVYPPQPELEFKLKYINAWEIDSYKDYGNIILGSLNFPIDSTGDILSKRFIEKQNQNDSLFVKNNLYSKNQIISNPWIENNNF